MPVILEINADDVVALSPESGAGSQGEVRRQAQEEIGIGETAGCRAGGVWPCRVLPFVSDLPRAAVIARNDKY